MGDILQQLPYLASNPAELRRGTGIAVVARPWEIYLDDLPQRSGIGRQDGNPVTEKGSFLDAVRDEHNSLTGCFPNPQQLILQVLTSLGIYCRKWFIHEKNLRIVRQGTGYRHPLLHATRKFVRITIGKTVKAYQVDEMITEPVKLTGTVNPYLTFRVAYRPYPGVSDTLKVFLSTNCGNSWSSTPVYNKSGVTLATGADLSTPFIPSVSADWRKDSVNLASYINGSVQVKFQSISGYGNNLYVDDIFIGEPAPSITVLSPDGGENWQQGSLHTISWVDNISENVKIELFKGGIYNLTISASTASTGSFSWLVPASQTPGSDYTVKITSVANSGLYDLSTSNFSISCVTFIAGTIASGQSICSGTAPTQLTGTAPAGGTTPYLYQWQSSTDNITFSAISGATSLNYTPGVLAVTTYFRQVQTSSGGCGSVYTNVLTITVNPFLPVSVSVDRKSTRLNSSH